MGAARVEHRGRTVSTGALLFVDGPFFDILPLPFLEGDPATALATPGSVVLTRSEARKLSGAGPVLGQVLTFRDEQLAQDFRVTGVIEDLPKNTHLSLTMLARFDPASPPLRVPVRSDWGCICGLTYVKLKQGADAQAIALRLPAWEKRRLPPRWQSEQEMHFSLVNVRDIHLGEAMGMRPNADRGFILNFAVVAVLILAMACINFTNLATAQASRRAREVALRKLLGASRQQLVAQFLGEAMLFTLLALVIALALVELSLAPLSHFLDADLAISYGDFSGVVLPILALAGAVGLASGVYPALYLSRFLPARVLKANASASEAPGSARLRSALVVVQFAVSVGLIICTLVVREQTAFARDLDPGYDRMRLLQIRNLGELREGGDAFMEQVRRLPGVAEASRGSVVLGFGGAGRHDLTRPGMTKPLVVEMGPVDPHFFAAAGLELKAGRGFDERRAADDVTPPPEELYPKLKEALWARTVPIVINETAAKRFGFADPDTAIGKTLNFTPAAGKNSVIIGVVEDARFGSARDPVLPMAYFWDRSMAWNGIVRFAGVDPRFARRGIEQVWRRFSPGVPMDAQFAQEVTARFYDAEEARGRIFAAFALIAVLVACLGLLGLAVFTAERRTKEIGVRKVFGARTRDIVRLLVWQASKPVVAANLIAWPLAWWAMRDWLNGFDARIALTPVPFVAAGALALAVAVGTVAAHTVRIARANPIHALRYE
jgi:putative ABC transport system permease protein